jgi:glycosyltransferase involved in cell wall biosynthesis
MKFSIITAVYNNRACIGSCLESVASQTYADIEHIIIDGGSTDGTLDVIARFTSQASRFAQVVSEPDNGIYDGLNKGIRLATGDVIGFLHADDIYADNTVIEKVVRAMSNSNAASCYGDLVYVRETGDGSEVTGDRETGSRFAVVRYWKSRPYEKGLFRKGWMPPHPTFFIRREVYEKFGTFNTGFRIAADYELILRFLWKENISTCYIPEVLIMMRIGGASNRSLRNILRKSVEDYRAIRMQHVGGVTTLLRKNLSKIPQFFKKTGDRP